MTDVRLTATNPEDSSVVAVACNAKGELKLEEPIEVPGIKGDKGDKGDDGADGKDGDPFTGSFSGDVTFTNGDLTVEGSVSATEVVVNTADTSRISLRSYLTVTRPSDGYLGMLLRYKTDDGFFTPGFQVLANGDLKAANGKAGFTEDGHLFCTTVRGQMVVLDTTSNGIGSWVEYTPTKFVEDPLNDAS